MVTFIKGLYQKVTKKSFINKILLTNILVFLIGLSLLAFIFSSSIASLLVTREINFNTQILNLVDNYYAQKQKSAMKFLQDVYLQNGINYPVLRFLKNDYADNDYDYINMRLAFDSFVTSGFSNDSDISSIQIYKSIDRSLFSTFRSKSPQQHVLSSAETPPLPNDDSSMGFKILSSNSKREYTFIANIMDEWLKKKVGVVMLNYASSAIENAYSQYKDNVKGYIVILSKEGDVIFDSSNRYYGKKYPYFDIVTSSQKKSKLEEVSYINTKTSETGQVVIAGIIPERELFSEVVKTRQSLYFIAALCFAFTIFLSYLASTIFSKRIKIIKSAMKRLRKGDFSTRIPLTDAEDELADISESFNKMGSELEDYINKVYLSNLKQKNAELSALQAQINPHFLYNTLEAIRMQAIAEGNEDVGDMIYLLAKFFRSTIKQEMIVKIKDEINYCRMYLDLFNIRYCGQLSVDIEIDEGVSEYGIVKYLLQPVIENYLVHGFDSDKESNKITLKGFEQDNDIYISVEDNGTGIEEERLNYIRTALSNGEKIGTSIGLSNVDERIKMIYGDTYGLDVSSEVGIGTKIIVKLGKKTREELKDNVQCFTTKAQSQR